MPWVIRRMISITGGPGNHSARPCDRRREALPANGKVPRLQGFERAPWTPSPKCWNSCLNCG